MKIEKKIISIAKNVLEKEANAILNLLGFIDENFALCVDFIYNAKGRLIVTGIGKSAIIANKIVATMNSTGTPAMFLHAADAIHGDLGMVQEDDVVLCLSKSGNTPEIKVLVPLLKRAGSGLIALVSNTNSYLAQNADFVINASIDEEACPLNLAPTTSTTVALALGDALAMCLLELREFTSHDFAKYHPGGALGKQLYLKVADLCDEQLLPVVNADASIKEVIVEISSKRLGATAVCDANRTLLGIITDGDLRRMMNKHDDFTSLAAKDIMTVNPKTIGVEEYAMEALNRMQSLNITQLAVVDTENKLLGFVHLHELLKEGII